ncbi:MAG TPA: YciI family protein [Vicinamibacterales bacterium]|jgi:hypothetical protein|nr:YciI family protein [Vicinamibacterales bacterium]
MKFMLMMHVPASAPPNSGIMTWAPAEIQAHIAFMKRFNEQLRASGELVEAQGLDFPPRPRIVRAQPNAQPLVTDGPFAETKELLAGFWIVECPSAERACEIAAAVSAAPGPGGAPLNMPIEVREVISAPPL